MRLIGGSWPASNRHTDLCTSEPYTFEFLTQGSREHRFSFCIGLPKANVCRHVSTCSTVICTRKVLLNPLLEFQSLTLIRTLARAVPCLTVTGTQTPVGVRRHGTRTSCFTYVPGISFCSFC